MLAELECGIRSNDAVLMGKIRADRPLGAIFLFWILPGLAIVIVSTAGTGADA